MTVTDESFARLRTWFDHALELDDAARDVFLARCAEQDATVAHQLACMLRSHAELERLRTPLAR
ncbi:hypothetical protein [Tahibacter amnicola]|uniref:Uncharacterized protein n=1 Tax=Tahibacter amnicola TaxID=2976241 RepID=A0ABY6BBX4_9GAMM|nr:hypothetical protein [Tahibacter amnicola]UXI67350.1 hypothetical protein N4264_21835 [Tahibacter amnicola]